MRIKSNKNKKLKLIKNIFKSNIKIISIGGISILLPFAVLLHSPSRRYLSRIIPVKYEDTTYRIFKEIVKIPLITKNYIKGNLTKPTKLSLEINFKNYKKLESKAEEAKKLGFLLSNPDDFVNAKLIHKKGSLKAKVRLKGDELDHLQNKKWSFRVKIKNDETYNGMNKFSLQSPKTRNFIYEWVYHRLLEKENLPSLQYSFVKLDLNGKDLGIYALEEHFDKQLLESNGFKEGPILKYFDSVWVSRRLRRLKGLEPNDGIKSLASSMFYEWRAGAHKQNKNLKDPILKKNLLNALYLLEGFQYGDLKTSDVFELEPLASYFAIIDLLGAHHSIMMSNLRFYYNPITSKLIPIGFDGQGGYPISSLSYDLIRSGSTAQPGTSGYTKLDFWEDPKFFKVYISKLEELSTKSYLDKFIEEIKDDLDKNINIIHKEFPRQSFKKTTLYKNQKKIKSMLNPLEPLNIYLQNNDYKSLLISVGNKQKYPIEILSINYKGEPIYKPKKTLLIMNRKYKKSTKYEELTIPLKNLKNNSSIINPQDLKIRYRVYGSNVLRDLSLIPYPRIDSIKAYDDVVRKKPNIDKYPFLKVNNEEKTISFKKGFWEIDSPLIVPSEYILNAGPGVKLNLKSQGLIYSNSPIKFVGSKENPIEINGIDGGQGIIVINAKSQSIIKYVNFQNLSNPSNNLWEVTGAVTFYESPVTISDSIFIRNNSEDSLNIVRSNFTMNNLEFKSSKFDALDVDFSDGDINNIYITNSGNDGIDISGSKVKIINAFLQGVEDKAISAGEKSFLEAKNIYIKESAVGIASKDLSRVKGFKVFLDSVNLGNVAYQKKPEYGSASIYLKDTKFNKVDKEYLFENGSIIKINGELYKPNGEDLKNKVYGTDYGKKSGT